MDKVEWQNGKITDSGLDFMRSQIGVKRPVPTWNRQVTRDGIEHFALGIGDDNPLWWDDEYAAASPWKTRVAPPCYLYSHTRSPRLKAEQGKQGVEAYLPGALGIWASDIWRWNRLPKEGDIIRAEDQLIDVIESTSRFGGRAVSQVERLTFTTSEGEVIAQMDHVVKRFERSEVRNRRTYLDRPLATYTAEDRARFAEQYESEIEARRGQKLRYFEDTKVGEKVGPMLKGPLTITNIVGYLLGGGSNLNPTNRILHNFEKLHPGAVMIHPETGIVDTIEAPHWEPALARASGLPTGYDLGCMRISWLSHLLTDWAGDHGFITELECKIIKPNLLGDVSWLNGEVVDLDEPNDTVTVNINMTNQLDEVTVVGYGKVKLLRRPTTA